MNVPELLKFLIVIEEEGHKKLADGATPADVAEWRVRAYKRLLERATDPAQDIEEAPQPSEWTQAAAALPPLEFRGDPSAKGMSDLVTPKQLGIIAALARSKGVDADEVSKTLLQVDTLSLKRDAADKLIHYLGGLEMPKAGPRRVTA